MFWCLAVIVHSKHGRWFEDTLYWSDWSGGMLASCNKFTGKQRRTILKEAGLKANFQFSLTPKHSIDVFLLFCKYPKFSQSFLPTPRKYKNDNIIQFISVV